MTEQPVWDGKPVKRACSNCGSLEWHEIRTMMEGTDIYDWCSECETPVQVSGTPDAFLPRIGMTFLNLCDKTGTPIPIMSKTHKVQVMKELGVSEAGDRVHGSAYQPSKSWVEGTREYRRKQFDKHRPELRRIYKEWRQKQ